METSNIIAITALIVSILGTIFATIFPYAVNFFKKSEFHGKLISLLYSPKMKHSIAGVGIGYVIKVSFIVLNKNFDVKKVNVKVKYPEEKKLYEGTIFASNTFVTTFDASKKMIGTYKLTIPNEQDILSLTAIDQDKPKNYYISFLVNKTNYEDFEKIRLTFIDYKSNERMLELYRRDINDINALFEPKVWKKME